MTINIRIKLAHSDAKVPTKNNFADAGWDLYSVEHKRINTTPYSIETHNIFGIGNMDISTPYGATVIKTGIHIQIPKGFVGLIWDRSGMAIKNSIHRVAGVIDSGFSGEVMIGLLNFGPAYEVKAGDRLPSFYFKKFPCM